MGKRIPKVIHYCWFGGKELPELAVRCIESWKKFLPDYEIKRWDERNFDVNMVPYTAQAYEARKYAFVSDYARLWILYHYGGLYFDTDVEVIRSIDDIVETGSFMGCENTATNLRRNGAELGVNPGLGLGVYPGHEIYRQLIERYGSMSFILSDGSYNLTTIVTTTTQLLCELGLKDTSKIQNILEIRIYPVDFFCPIDYKTGKLTITKNTRTIHHYTASWKTWNVRFKESLIKIMGPKLTKVVLQIKRCFK